MLNQNVGLYLQAILVALKAQSPLEVLDNPKMEVDIEKGLNNSDLNLLNSKLQFWQVMAFKIIPPKLIISSSEYSKEQSTLQGHKI